MAQLRCTNITFCSNGNTIFSVDGANGRLLEVTDDLSNSIFSANTIAGLPVIEAFANNCVVLGQFGGHRLEVTCTSIRGGLCNTASGTNSITAGGRCNTASGVYSFVGGGNINTACNTLSFVGGGNNNCSSGCRAFIGGGGSNTASSSGAAVVGGSGNSASGFYSFVGGGAFNSSSGCYSFIGGGSGNIASGPFSAVGNGGCAPVLGLSPNCATGIASGVFVGSRNQVNGNESFIGGGECHTISSTGCFSSISGGCNNTITCNFSFIGGGGQNAACQLYSTIAGGWRNLITTSGYCSFIGGGDGNRGCGRLGVIGGGFGNTIGSSQNAFIGGGIINLVSNNFSSVVGGCCNCVTNTFSFIGGGLNNTVSGCYSSILGGRNSSNFTHCNAHIIGSCIIATASNFTFVNNLCQTGGGLSDRRIKNTIEPINFGLKEITQLNPVSFCWNGDESCHKNYGFIAQEIQQTMSCVVTCNMLHRLGPDGIQTLGNEGEPLLQFEKDAVYASYANAFKELKAENDALRQRITIIENILKNNNLL